MTTVFVKEELLARQLVHTFGTAHLNTMHITHTAYNTHTTQCVLKYSLFCMQTYIHTPMYTVHCTLQTTHVAHSQLHSMLKLTTVLVQLRTEGKTHRTALCASWAAGEIIVIAC